MEQDEIIQSIISKAEKVFSSIEIEFLNKLITSPYRKTFMAMATQLEALNDETILAPFTIRPSKKENQTLEDQLVEAQLSQKLAETQLKFMKERREFAEDVESLRLKLTEPTEKQEVSKKVGKSKTVAV